MRRLSTRTVVLTGLVLALLIAGVVSYYASASPDGLNRVAGDLGFSSAERASGGGPLAGYEVAGLDHSRISGGLAGVLGCLVVLGLSTLLFRLRRSSEPAPAPVRSHREGE
ncbi:PDGLE domain-containing protein [Nocardioides sp.]|uniref:PDGLE domain-containing protein n=1 Tax=Nocardioides sp. TaxID=35761 RepID=UPI002633DB79|nr:PDGLE domain-containing protein [Nocardioides sp.]MCW2736589.1 cobalt transporter permease [Nocardioides sp.]